MEHYLERPRYRLRHLGPPVVGAREEARALAGVLTELEESGLCPLLPDGRVAGNAAIRLAGGRLLVSPSGRQPGLGASCGDDFVEVLHFDAAQWSADYRSRRPDIVPSADTPLHWAALVEAPSRFGWSCLPRVAVHGHGLASAEQARRLGVPISPVLTPFGTPEDRLALLTLMGAHPYPAQRLFVRRLHGFFLLEQDVLSLLAAVRRLVPLVHLDA